MVRPGPASLRLCAALLLVAVASCSTQTIVAVDPFPCGDGGNISGCGPRLLDGLVGFWRLNETSGANVRDSSGWANDGTLQGLDPMTSWIAGGPEGEALSVEAKGHITVPDSASIDTITDRLTMTAWMYIDGTIATDDYATAISRQIGGGFGQHYHMGVNSSMQPVTFITTGTNANQLARFAPATVPAKTWFHLAVTYDGVNVVVYLNAAQVDSGALTGQFVPETNPVVLSGNTNAGSTGESVPGRLADVMLYSRALSAREITRIYQGAVLAPKPHPTDAGGQ
jgi:hypothetical protein